MSASENSDDERVVLSINGKPEMTLSDNEIEMIVDILYVVDDRNLVNYVLDDDVYEGDGHKILGILMKKMSNLRGNLPPK